VARAKKSDPTDTDVSTHAADDAFTGQPDAEAPVGGPSDNHDQPFVLAEPITDVPQYAPPTPPPVRPSTPARRSIFLPLVFGGAVSAGLGAAAVIYTFPSGFQPAAQAPDLAPQFAALSERIDKAQSLAETAGSDAANLRADLDTQAALPGLADLPNRLTPLETGLADLATRLEAFDTRLTDLEKRPLTGGTASSGALDAFQRELDAMRAEVTATKTELASAATDAASRIAAAEAEAEKTREATMAETRRATARAALSHVQAALETGAPIEGALADLATAGVSVPAELTEQSSGVPSLANLRAAFPEAARDALALSLRDTAGDGMIDRTMAFLRSQSGARSLSPRAGDDPDAVLSRSEAALGVGDLETAIGELSGLPESGKARMAEWIGLAQRRLAAVEAVATLSGSLN
jgi:hypothetical protein